MLGTIGVETPARGGGAPSTTADVAETIFLGSATATRENYRDAIILTAVLLAALVATAPFASRPLPIVPAFAPAYDAAIIVLELITALLLYAQFRQTRERAFLALACGYLFTPLLITAHALSFPEAFGAGSVIGGPQTTAWLWMGWHALFPLFVIAYALLAWRDRFTERSAMPVPRYTAHTAIAGTIGLAVAVILITTVGERFLPPLMIGSHYEPTTRLFLLAGWLAHFAALTTLIWATRVRRIIDLWLAVTLVALIIDLALSAMLVTGRYQLGFYLGRGYGLLAAVFVLSVLLREAVALYGKAVRAARDAALAQSVAERDELRRQLALAEEVERQRLARELHDEVGQHISALGLGLQAVSDVSESGADVRQRVGQLKAMVNTLGRELHSVAVRLRPRALDDFGLDAALSAYAEEWSRTTGIAVDVHADHGAERLPMVVESAVYRVVQEALTNVARHSGSSRAGVVVERRNGHLVTVVEDSGIGFQVELVSKGKSQLGLRGIRERAELLGGSMDIETSPGGGTTLFVRIPINHS
ncbi:MAG TPA: MASE4 domain-containing protein [Gemmatimonadaceae bacterium]|nr:MASE4 domain-containing protein [Gemmatimonadaceae bacterium]